MYLAIDEIEKKLCVIKQVPLKKEENFYEGRILKKLKHPGIVMLNKQVEDNDYYYLVMEYCGRMTLENYKAEEVLTFTQVIIWGIEMCDVLIFLQKQRPSVIHRDIKPANIVVTKDKKLKLIDFGIARWSFQKDKKSYGTRGYAAPEQFYGEYSSKSDVYNLGATLNWCWKGKSSWYWKQLIRKSMNADQNKRYTAKQLKRRLKWLAFWV